jgi:hypothetical protein
VFAAPVVFRVIDFAVTGRRGARQAIGGGHAAVPADWRAFLDFADRHVRAAGN